MPQLPVLRRYYEGPSVRLLQTNLYGLNQNYNGLMVTGVFDSLTEEVVRNFQAEHRLVPDGIVGPATWGVLLEEVSRVQQRLNSAGFNAGPVDGIFGPRTTDAVERFQRANGLAVTGTVTPRTRQQLFNPDRTDDYDTRPSSASLDSLHPYVANLARRFLDLARADGIDARVISAFRSWDEQDRLYTQGRTAPGSIVTDAMGGDSYHNWGLAFDVAPFVNGAPDWSAIDLFNRMGELGQQVGLEWGGNWTTFQVALIDRPHFQYTFGLSTQQLLEGARPPEQP